MTGGRLLLVGAALVVTSAMGVGAGAAQPAPTGAGAPLDVAKFRYARDIPAGTPGPSSLQLDAPVLGHSESPNFGDVRIVTPDGRQIPYLLERLDDPLTVRLPPLERIPAPPGARLASPDALGARSYYRLRMPSENLNARLVVATGARVFERGVDVGVERANARRDVTPIRWLASATWRHEDASAPAPALTIDLPRVAARDLVLVVDEGDNQPLPLAPPEIQLPGWRLRFVRETGAACTLLYGRDDLAPPRYDLALLSSDLPPDARAVTVGPERPVGPPRFSMTVSPVLFWVVLLGAVGVLLVLIVRLFRSTAG
jgi:hypothetical protein